MNFSCSDLHSGISALSENSANFVATFDHSEFLNCNLYSASSGAVSDEVFATSNSADLISACLDSICYNSTHHATSTDFVSIGYDDAILQSFSQIVGAEAKPSEVVLRLAPSMIEPPNLELKPLPENLKYAFLAPNEKLPVIIAKDLLPEQEEKLLNILR